VRAKVQELDKEENFFLVRVAAASGEEKVGSVNVPPLATHSPSTYETGFEKEGARRGLRQTRKERRRNQGLATEM
jgi:hypothetical protein